MGRPSRALQGKVAVITGSTRGFGLLLAAALAQAGAAIAICGRQMRVVEDVYQQLTAIPGVQVLGAACDVRVSEQVDSLAEQVVQRFGAIDVWVNNAAIAGSFARSGDVACEEWQAVIDTNLIGTFNGTRAPLRYMLPKNSGKIINVVGSGAQITDQGWSYLSAYGVSKAGILRFTQLTAEEYRGTNLSILAVAPGPLESDLLEHTPARSAEAEARRDELRTALQKSTVDKMEVADLVVRLAGRESDGITGKVYAAQSEGRLLHRFLGRK